jgi:hypothetical protein
MRGGEEGGGVVGCLPLLRGRNDDWRAPSRRFRTPLCPLARSPAPAPWPGPGTPRQPQAAAPAPPWSRASRACAPARQAPLKLVYPRLPRIASPGLTSGDCTTPLAFDSPSRLVGSTPPSTVMAISGGRARWRLYRAG